MKNASNLVFFAIYCLQASTWNLFISFLWIISKHRSSQQRNRALKRNEGRIYLMKGARFPFLVNKKWDILPDFDEPRGLSFAPFKSILEKSLRTFFRRIFRLRALTFKFLDS